MLSGVEAFLGFFGRINRLLISLPRLTRHVREAGIDFGTANGFAAV